LQNGLYIDDVSLSNIKVKQLYIKWHEKVEVSVKEILLTSQKTQSNTKIEPEDIGNYLKKLSQISHWFESITIEKVLFDDITASFKYKYGQKGYIIASSENFDFKSSLYYESQFLNMDIATFTDHKRNIALDGIVYFNRSKMELYSDINININNDLDAKIFISTDVNQLKYKLKVNKNIKDISHLINIANLPKEARYWALDAIKMSDVSLDSATGYIDFNNIKDAYKNIHIKATVNKLNYAYDTTLDSIHTHKTLLEFKDGTLFIYPKEAYTYNMYLDQSWLKIDFTQKDEILTLHLLFDGKLNKDLLQVLNRYKIKLPFLQKKGTVRTNLKLVVNLMSVDVSVNGDFFTKSANFDYLGLNIDIFDAYIKLNNYDVQINDMKAQYKDIVRSNVDVTFNAKDSTGTLSFEPAFIHLAGATLLKEKSPLKITYNIAPKNDTINIEKSKWKYKDITLNIDKTTLPFDLNTLLITIPNTFVEVDTVGSGSVSGSIAVDTMKMKLKADILKLDYSGLKLSQSMASFNISYEKKLHIVSHSNILFHVNDYAFDMNNFAVGIEGDTLYLRGADLLSTDGLLAMQASAAYNINKDKGVVSLKNLKIENKDQLLYEKEKVEFSFAVIKNNLHANSQELGLEFSTTDTGWSTKLHSLASLYEDSQLLQKFKLQEGKINFYKKNTQDSIQVNATIQYPYQFLMQNDTPVLDYNIQGEFSAKKSFFNINNSIDIAVDEEIKIDIQKNTLNIPALMNSFNDINSSNTQENKKITLNAVNTNLDLGGNRKILSDIIHLEHHNNITKAELKHKKGVAIFKLGNDKIHLYGDGFGDVFMENLISFSKFEGGNLTFSMDGNIKDYDGLFFISDAVIVEYRMLNNILAFVNTVPSLATFSLPGYNKSGLKVNSAYMNFNAKHSLFDISDFFLESKEINIFGSGTADLLKDKVDITLNLKTDLGSSVSNIPLVGYIILGKDTVSTTMSITGKLSDPDVKSLIAKEILVAPINIIKRALFLPYELLKTEQNTKENK